MATSSWRVLCAAVCGMALLAAGCGNEESKRQPENALKQTSLALPSVEVKTATFKEVTQAIKAHKGKVVVVDVWGTFCVPCKKEFHNLVEIHRQYPADQLVCMSVAISPSEPKDALEFLKSKGAAFQNFLLDEDQSDKFTEAWNFRAVPALFVFDTQGKPKGFTLDDPRHQTGYKELRDHLKKLLPTKP